MINISKSVILDSICYTELVYARINKKLKTNLSKDQIHKLMFELIEETDQNLFEKMGKNYYVSNIKQGIRITINSNNYRIITVDKVKVEK